MPTIPLNGAHLRVRLIDIELTKLKLDPENPRLHSAYLTHQLRAQPSEKQIAQVLEQLPEFQALLDAITRNDGCFQAPLITVDGRVLEGNRRVTALRKVRSSDPKNKQWQSVTVQQLTARIPPDQEKALRAKFHLENALPWDGLSQLTEYLGVAEREGADFLANLLGRFRPQIEPLLVAGRCVRKFSAAYPELVSQDLLWILVGLCGVKQIEPQVAFSRTLRIIFTEEDEARPEQQPYTLAQVCKWLAEGRFTKPYESEQRKYRVKPAQVPTLFREVRRAGEEVLAYFLEADGSLAKALSYLQGGLSPYQREQRRALKQTQQFLDVLNGIKVIRRDETPDFYRQALACYHRLEQLLGTKRSKEVTHVQ